MPPFGCIAVVNPASEVYLIQHGGWFGAAAQPNGGKPLATGARLPSLDGLFDQRIQYLVSDFDSLGVRVVFVGQDHDANVLRRDKGDVGAKAAG